MRTLLICHADDNLNSVALTRWLADVSDLKGVIVLRESGRRKVRRIRRAIKRTGFWRFLDVLAYRMYYRLMLRRSDREWEQAKISEICRLYPATNAPTLVCASPNSAEALEFIQRASPDLMIARCKTLLREEVFSLPRLGTFVMHPGICPEYRNAHGCFWALANNDLKNVGMTLLQVDKGVDTGKVYGYYFCKFDEVRESHIIIQHRTVFDNLDLLADKLRMIYESRATPLNTEGRPSATWGQPWLTRYLRWKQAARRRAIEA